MVQVIMVLLFWYSRLKPIVDTLFPRAGAKGIQLKDFPPNIFVKIIYFIARVSSTMTYLVIFICMMLSSYND